MSLSDLLVTYSRSIFKAQYIIIALAIWLRFAIDLLSTHFKISLEILRQQMWSITLLRIFIRQGQLEATYEKTNLYMIISIL